MEQEKGKNMKKAYIFVFGGSSTLALSIFLFIVIPRMQVDKIVEKKISVQKPYNQIQSYGRQKYIEYGCIYCHSQQVRDPSAGGDKSFGWGRASIASDYIHDKPHLLGTMRTGPDLSNIGSRQPSKAWHYLHFYNPRKVVDWSIMPGFPFLFKKVIAKKKPEKKALKIPGEKNTWIIPKKEADALVEYMLSLKRNKVPLKNSGEN